MSVLQWTSLLIREEYGQIKKQRDTLATLANSTDTSANDKCTRGAKRKSIVNDALIWLSFLYVKKQILTSILEDRWSDIS